MKSFLCYSFIDKNCGEPMYLTAVMTIHRDGTKRAEKNSGAWAGESGKKECLEAIFQKSYRKHPDCKGGFDRNFCQHGVYSTSIGTILSIAYLLIFPK
jgi:hypothetical protein